MSQGTLDTYGNRPWRTSLVVSSALLFTVSFVYFYRFGNGLFFYQEKETLFIFSRDYLHGFLRKPGGLLEYAGNFLAQGYFSKAYGSIVVSFSLLLFFALGTGLNNHLTADPASTLPLGLLAPCLLLIAQTGENHYIHHTVGYLLTGLCFLAALKTENGKHNIFIPVLFPLFFYIAGSFALLFALVYIVYCLVYKNGIQKYLNPGILILTAIITFFIFKEFIFLLPADKLLLYPLNLVSINDLNISEIILSAYVVFFSLLAAITNKIKNKNSIPAYFPKAGLATVFSATLIILILKHDQIRPNDLKIEELYLEQNPDALISLQEKASSGTITGLYFYNLALTENDILCDRMFNASQDNGVRSLLPTMTPEYKMSLSYFYYSMGLINEAHHLAYESMVTEGYRSENLKMLIKTDLINGYFNIADRNINILKKTLHYRRWAERYQKMLYKPEVVSADPELGGKIKLLPRRDFFISPSVIENIDLMLMANPDNIKAFGYKMAWLLLEKDYRAVMYQVKRMKDMNYTRIPRHIEEAMMTYINSGEELPYLGDFKISDETRHNFSNFMNEMEQYKTGSLPGMEKAMKSKWGNTFWYYFEFK